MSGPATDLAQVDALADLDARRHYVDPLVEVFTQTRPAPFGQAPPIVSTTHFDVWHADRLVLGHRVPDERIDDDLTALLESELFGPGWVAGAEVFERLFTGIVRTSRASAVDAWTLFYRNTLELDGEFAAIHRHAEELVDAGVVLEMGSCFGFLALRLARDARRYVTATDVTAGTMRLLQTVAPRLDVGVRTLVCDAARVPRPDLSVDTVVCVHLLEHLDVEHGSRVLDEARRLARRRVVVAVPYEETPTAAYGHVRVVTRRDLEAWGAAAHGWTAHVEDHLGGWLVLDRVA